MRVLRESLKAITWRRQRNKPSGDPMSGCSSRGNSTCKSPGVEVCQARPRNSREVGVAGREWQCRWGVGGETGRSHSLTVQLLDSQSKDQAVLRWYPTGGLECHYRGVGVTLSELTLRLKYRWGKVGAGGQGWGYCDRDASYLDQKGVRGGEVRWCLDIFEDGTETWDGGGRLKVIPRSPWGII